MIICFEVFQNFNDMAGWKNWKGNQVKAIIAEGTDRAINATLEAIGSAADQEIPLDEGTLLRSKHIDVEDGQGVISYGGGPGTGHPKVPYAKRWHENSANFQHGRKERYLADPFNKMVADTFKRAIKKELRGEL